MRKFVMAALTAVLLALPASAQADGQFARMFPTLAPFTAPTDAQLAALVQSQLDPNADSGNSAAVPSFFTYFGQFIDHDITLDGVPQPTQDIDPTTLTNGRTPRLDLDSVYGGGPAVSPQLYEGPPGYERFKLQDPNPNGVPDLPRNADGSAILVESRNDENQVIAQIHLAFLKLHNHFIDLGQTYAEARRNVLDRYRRVVFTDYLPHVVGYDRYIAILDRLAPSDADNNLTSLLASLRPRQGAFDPSGNRTPIEFSVATFRFGHSQVRRAYRLQPGAANTQVFSATAPDLRGGRNIQAGRQINWRAFVDVPGEGTFDCATRNCSRKIDTLISSSLFVLPIPGAEASGSNVLGFRNLVRADRYGLPSGEAVAGALGIPPLSAAERGTLGPGFETETPLWYYGLLEGQVREDGAVLGDVFAAIDVETLADMLKRETAAEVVAATTPLRADQLLVEAGVMSATP